jgi:hypothetical protein
MSIPARFGQYEVFRIILPGYYSLGALLALFYSFYPTRFFLLSFIYSNIFYLAIGGGIFIGLLLYAYNYPRKTIFYKEKIEPLLPHKYLKSILCDECKQICEKEIKTDGDARNYYYYLLYNLFDHNSQGVIHYFGSLYRVYTNIRIVTYIFGFLEIIISIGNLAVFLLFIPVSYSVFISNTMGVFCLGVLFILMWVFLVKYPKGDDYMIQIINFQRTYLDLKKEDIIRDICP